MRKGTSIRFVAVGLVNTVTGLLVIWFAKGFLAWGDSAANGAGYAVALVISFLLNKQWTFEFRGRFATALLRFLAVILMAYALNLATVLCLIHTTPLSPLLCQALGIAPYSLIFYFGCRVYVFKTTSPVERSKAQVIQ